MISVIVPYYRQPKMFEKHLDTWLEYSPTVREALRLIVVDDCSPESAQAVLGKHRAAMYFPDFGQLYRVTEDVAWNRSMVRNLGSHVATTPWLLHMDTDHILPAKAAEALVRFLPKADPKCWYRFRRFRVGKADFTRNKDAIPREQEFGEIKPHVDSYLCTHDHYWKAGGYDPDYAGILGGGGAFLRQLGKVGTVLMAPSDVHLHVYTTDKVPDASIKMLDRNTEEYGRRRRIKERAGNIKVTNPLRYPWERIA